VELNEILQIALRGGASDIHLKAGLPPMFRVDGSLVPLKDGKRLPPEEVARMAFGIMNEYQRDRFKNSNEVDLAYGVPGLGRFRVNVFQQRGTLGAVLRVIPFKVMTVRDLLLPPVLEAIALEQRGLVLVTGTTGSGKSTTLAAMIDHINANETNHIMTIEDPIEFLIRDKRSIVNQREVGVDTVSFSQALKSALRQDPDVILVGEMRDLETIETALTAAETGHLVMSTLHTLDATETINRIVSVFPPYQQKQVRLQLGSVLKAVISQRLVPRADGKGRVAAVEVLKATARVRELIHRPGAPELRDADLRPVADEPGAAERHHLRRGPPPGHQPRRFRAPLQRHQRHQRRPVGRLRGSARRREHRPGERGLRSAGDAGRRACPAGSGGSGSGVAASCGPSRQSGRSSATGDVRSRLDGTSVGRRRLPHRAVLSRPPRERRPSVHSMREPR
jgi:pilus retraction protein PilT